MSSIKKYINIKYESKIVGPLEISLNRDDEIRPINRIPNSIFEIFMSTFNPSTTIVTAYTHSVDVLNWGNCSTDPKNPSLIEFDDIPINYKDENSIPIVKKNELLGFIHIATFTNCLNDTCPISGRKIKRYNLYDSASDEYSSEEKELGSIRIADDESDDDLDEDDADENEEKKKSFNADDEYYPIEKTRTLFYQTTDGKIRPMCKTGKPTLHCFALKDIQRSLNTGNLKCPLCMFQPFEIIKASMNESTAQIDPEKENHIKNLASQCNDNIYELEDLFETDLVQDHLSLLKTLLKDATVLFDSHEEKSTFSVLFHKYVSMMKILKHQIEKDFLNTLCFCFLENDNILGLKRYYEKLLELGLDFEEINMKNTEFVKQLSNGTNSIVYGIQYLKKMFPLGIPENLYHPFKADTTGGQIKMLLGTEGFLKTAFINSIFNFNLRLLKNKKTGFQSLFNRYSYIKRFIFHYEVNSMLINNCIKNAIETKNRIFIKLLRILKFYFYVNDEQLENCLKEYPTYVQTAVYNFVISQPKAVTEFDIDSILPKSQKLATKSQYEDTVEFQELANALLKNTALEETDDPDEWGELVEDPDF